MYFIMLLWIILSKFSFLLKTVKYILVPIYFLSYLPLLSHVYYFPYFSHHDHDMISESGTKSEAWERIVFVSASVKNSSIRGLECAWYKKERISEL